MRPLDPEAVAEAKAFAERGLWAFESLHIGPRDYNVFQAVDYLRTAASLLEEAERVARTAQEILGDPTHD